MKQFAIIADSSCGLQKQYRERFGIDGIIYGTITYPDGKTVFGDMDYETVSPEEYFGTMTKKAIYKTACANLDQMKAVMEPFAKEGKDIVFICLSSALSGTYNFGVKAAEEIMEAYPQVKVYVIDSLRYCTALGLLVQEVCALRDQGATAKEAADWAEENKHCFHQAGIMDDLYFLARTGRIAKAKAFFGTMVGVKPMGEFTRMGLTEVIGKGKGTRKSLDAVVAYLQDRAVEPDKHIVFICDSLRPKEADYLQSKVEELVHPKEIIRLPLDMTSGANMGPGLAVCFFYGKPISENLEEEKAVMTAILNK